MAQRKAGEPRVNCQELQEKYQIPLELVLDAVSLGMKDKEIAEVTGLKLGEVKKLRGELGGIGSTLESGWTLGQTEIRPLFYANRDPSPVLNRDPSPVLCKQRSVPCSTVLVLGPLFF